jgi:hypothetical protein
MKPILLYSKKERSQVPVGHACNPSYSGGRDQEDCGSKPAQANSSGRPYLEKPFTKNWIGGVAQGSSPSTAKRKERKKEREREMKERKKKKERRKERFVFMQLLNPGAPEEISQEELCVTQEMNCKFTVLFTSWLRESF